MSKEVLIITSYYPPETGAAANRIYNLATGLSEEGFNVSVITPAPNYPKGKIFSGYRDRFKYVTTENTIKVYRLWLYASNSKNIIKRLFAMLSYSISLLVFFLFNKIPNKVIVQSPPLIVAFTCMLFLRSRKRKLILNVSDLWPLAGLELGAFKKNLIYKILQRIERFNYKKANVIMGQSEEILSHVKVIFPDKQLILYRNFPKEEELALSNSTQKEGKLRIVYAGLLGHAQGIYKLLQSLDLTNIEFHIYGAGAEQNSIEEFISNNNNTGVFYHGVVSRELVLEEIQKHHLVIIPLLNRIYGSVPSKIF